MPTIEGSKKDLEKLVGKKFSHKELEEALLFAKGELEEAQGDKIKIDVKDTNRPDLWSIEGIARELRARIGRKKGLHQIRVEKGKVELLIEKSVKESRPLMVAAVAKGIRVNEDFLVQMIQLQEKVGLTYGRRRKETGIGLYDLDKITPPIYYKGYRPRQIKFAPLEFEREMNLDEILEHHPKGREYGHLVKSFEFYPIVIDSKGIVCSMPPIINSNYTGKVTEKTKNIFIEVTGWKQEYVNTALNVIVAALAERGAKIESVKIRDGKKVFYTPNFSPKKTVVEQEYFRKISGMQWSSKQIVHLLQRAGYEAKASGKNIVAKHAAFRQDILHPADVVEDAIISFGYNNFVTEHIEMSAKGEELQQTRLVDTVREACVGLGLQEVLSFALTSKETQEKKMLLEKQELVEIANPVSANWQVFRKQILPELLSFLSKNKHASYPQKVFETGKVVLVDKKSETSVREPSHLSIVLCHDEASFTEIKSCFEAIAKSLGWKATVHAIEHASFEKGRTAAFKGDVSGIFGELNARVLENFGIETKASALEIEF